MSYAGLVRLWAQGIIHLGGIDGQRCDRGVWGWSITSDSAGPRQNPTFSDHRKRLVTMDQVTSGSTLTLRRDLWG